MIRLLWGSVYPKENDFVVAESSLYCKNLECFVFLRYFLALSRVHYNQNRLLSHGLLSLYLFDNVIC